MTKQKTCVFNIIANDYYPQQQVFIHNFKKIHKDIDVYCISLENKDFKSNDFTTIKLKDIKNIPQLNFMTFKYVGTLPPYNFVNLVINTKGV